MDLGYSTIKVNDLTSSIPSLHDTKVYLDILLLNEKVFKA